jgi:hypothetical protein
MWLAIISIVGFLFGVFWYLFSVAINSHLRTLAETHPGSILYWYIKLSDRILKAILLRRALWFSESETKPKQFQEAQPADDGVIRSLHDFADVAEMISIRQSFSVSIDLTQKIPPFLIKVIGNPVVGPAIVMISMLIMFMAGIYFLSPVATANTIAVLAAALAAPMVIGLLIGRIVADPKGFFGVMRSIYFGPYFTINIDDTLIVFDSFGGRRAKRNTHDCCFVAVTGEFNKGLSFVECTGKPALEIFLYPTLIEDLIMNDHQLTVFCSRLNKLAAHARALPRKTYDEFQV